MVNFTACANVYINNTELVARWNWSGPVKGIQKNPESQITYEGCKVVCGEGSEWYPWSQSSSTITTWLLPIVGMLLQAPFESNAFWKTMLSLARWVGSPMASLSYILWNISVTGKCALMVDMAVPYDYRSSSKHTDFGNIRDSFYILMTLNQYSIKPVASLKDEAEGLLRIVLFSKDLRLLGTKTSLREMRQDLAQSLRKRRRRGVVPVFISTMWFLFSLAISIQAAFGLIGQNATAHDLAIGLLLGWLPILILCSIVDRNPAAADDVRDQINHLIDTVCLSLQDDTIANEYTMSFAAQPESSKMKQRVAKVNSQVQFLQHNFLTSFAGQGRVRWHYGAADPILSDIENCYVAEHGRDWLRNEEQARTKLVLGSVDRGLFWFDFRELWQITAAVIIVAGTSLGAFIISYFTPTVGLGCRSLGYLIFGVIALFLLMLEFLVWWLTTEEREEERLRRRSSRFQNATFVQLEQSSAGMLTRAKSWALQRREQVEEKLLHILPTIASWCYFSKRGKKRKEFHTQLSHWFRETHGYTTRQLLDRLVFIPAEVINATWLAYIVLAQTFGIYANCRCKSSNYGLGGGYLDLRQSNEKHNASVRLYWVAGTTLSCTILGLGMSYVVIEWCLQSHLSTESYDHARKGLQRTRVFRHYTFLIRYPTTRLILFINSIHAILFLSRSRQKTLVWTKNSTYATNRRVPPAFPFGQQHHGSVGDGGDADTAGVRVPLIDAIVAPDVAHNRLKTASSYSGHSAYSPGEGSAAESAAGIEMWASPPSSPTLERRP